MHQESDNITDLKVQDVYGVDLKAAAAQSPEF